MMGRRSFLYTAAGLPLAAARNRGIAQTRRPPRPRLDPSVSGIEHVVMVILENRSFDHLLGWLPNSNGKQAGLSYSNSAGMTRHTFPLAPDYTGCPYPDLDHSYEGGRIQYDGGKMDGFLLEADNPFALGYYTSDDLSFCSALALNYTTLDQYFCSVLGPTYPNRIFLQSAQTDRLDNSFSLCTLPTIWDALSSANVSAGYYYHNVSFLGLWGEKYVPIARTYSQFLSDAARGTLPSVAMVDPLFTLTGGTTGNDFEPHSDIRAGDAFIAQTFRAVFSGPHRTNTVFVVSFDEWGGFFDHVPPPRVVAPNNVDPDLVNGKALLGFRVPTIVASPFTRGTPRNPRVSHFLYDHTSLLKLIEWRWGLPPLTARDASDEIGNLASELDLERPVYEVPQLPFPQEPTVQPCSN